MKRKGLVPGCHQREETFSGLTDFLFEETDQDGRDERTGQDGEKIQKRLVDQRYDKNSAMRSRQGDAEHHGDRTGHGRSHNARSQNPQGIGGGKRNCSFGDERSAHHVIGQSGFALFVSELVFEESGCQRNAERRNHSPGHDGGVGGEVAGFDGGDAEGEAALFTGPPMSTAIMPPKINPRMTALVPLIPFSQSVSHWFSAATGVLITSTINTPVIRMPKTG